MNFEKLLGEQIFKTTVTHVQYIKIVTRLRGFGFKIANFSRVHFLAIPRGDVSTKETKPNMEE